MWFLLRLFLSSSAIPPIRWAVSKKKTADLLFKATMKADLLQWRTCHRSYMT